MKNISRTCCTLAIVLALFVPSFADTIRLKDGSVIRGQVVGFKDQQFTVLIGAGAKGRRSRTLIYVEDVESIEFDSGTNTAGIPTNEDTSNVVNREPSQPRTSTQPAATSTPSTDRPPSGNSTFFTIKVMVR